MSEKVLLLNTGVGNIQSVANILEFIGANFEISDRPEALGKADKIIFPGVGTYGNAMENIRQRGLVDPLRRSLLEEKKPGLGICVGMQVMSDFGTEFGTFEGLGLIPGRVERVSHQEGTLRLPHVGWNDVVFEEGSPLFKGVAKGASFYFLHSYHFRPANNAHVICTVEYGERVVAAVQRENIFGVQFHPEKSQESGIQLMKNFVEL